MQGGLKGIEDGLLHPAQYNDGGTPKIISDKLIEKEDEQVVEPIENEKEILVRHL